MNSQEDTSLLEGKAEGSRPGQVKRSTSSEEWDEGSSTCSSSSCYSASCSDDSYIANWENHVCSDGSLFYVEYIHHVGPRAPSANETALNVIRNDFGRASTRRSGRNKLSRMVGKGENREHGAQHSQGKADTLKVFNENALGEIKEVEAIINPENRFKFGRRASVTEALLGLSTIPFRDGIRLMVAGHMINTNNAVEKSTGKVGDWFKSINDTDISVQNVNEVLSQFLKPTKVRLRFQRNVEEDSGASGNNSIQQIVNFDHFVNSANKLLLPSLETSSDKDNAKPFLSVVILNLDLSEIETEGRDLIFCYPKQEINDLFPVRGSLITLHSILRLEMKTEPQSVALVAGGEKWNVCFQAYEKILLILGINSKYATKKEVLLRLSELDQYLRFTYDIVEASLTENAKTEIQQMCNILELRLKKCRGSVSFENILLEPRLISLPKEAQLRIFDALSEMSAMDYRDWNEEPLNSHREFFIFGSALYFRSHLLASLMPASQLLGVESFLRCKGILDIIERQAVRDLVVWSEIPMVSSSNRYFLAISSRNQLTLAVILQAFEPERRVTDSGTLEEKIIGPSLFYIEEIQETLDHLRHGGIEALARVWVTSNKRPEVAIVADEAKEKTSKKKSDTSSGFRYSNVSSDDVRVNSSMGGSSAQSLTHSEDSNQKMEDCDSDSDWDGFPDSHKSSSGFDMSELRDSFLKEISDVVPARITAAKQNVLLHYIHLDVGAGMILTPPETYCPTLLDKFRSACHLIHTILQNTKRFRRLLSQESSKPNTHKSLVAIKEHGVLISLGGEGANETTFWVIGRLFASPTRELYVCHKSDAPQNLVEIAFRLSFLTAG